MNSPDYKFLRTLGQTDIDPSRFISLAPHSGTIQFADYQDPNKWYVKDNNMARNINRKSSYEIQEVENGFIVLTGTSQYTGGYATQYVFNTIKEVNDFIAKRNQEELV